MSDVRDFRKHDNNSSNNNKQGDVEALRVINTDPNRAQWTLVCFHLRAEGAQLFLSKAERRLRTPLCHA